MIIDLLDFAFLVGCAFLICLGLTIIIGAAIDAVIDFIDRKYFSRH